MHWYFTCKDCVLALKREHYNCEIFYSSHSAKIATIMILSEYCLIALLYRMPSIL